MLLHDVSEYLIDNGIYSFMGGARSSAVQLGTNSFTGEAGASRSRGGTAAHTSRNTQLTCGFRVHG